MDIFLSVNNREEVIQLPIVPSEFKISSPYNNETFTTINLGDIKLFGESGLKSISIATFFPVKKYPFSRNKEMFGWEYVEMIESWRKRKLRVRLIATGTPINLVFAIDDFEYGLQDGSGDIYYSLSLSEFPMIQLQKKSLNQSTQPKSAANASGSPKPTAKGDMKTTSIVVYLKSIGVDSSFSNRRKMAAKHGIKNYSGTAQQNLLLLKKLRGG